MIYTNILLLKNIDFNLEISFLGGRGGRGGRGGGRGGYQKPTEPQQHAGNSNKNSPDLDEKSVPNDNAEEDNNSDQTGIDPLQCRQLFVNLIINHYEIT